MLPSLFPTFEPSPTYAFRSKSLAARRCWVSQDYRPPRTGPPDRLESAARAIPGKVGRPLNAARSLRMRASAHSRYAPALGALVLASLVGLGVARLPREPALMVILAGVVALALGMVRARLIARPHPGLGLALLLLSIPLRSLATAEVNGSAIGLTEAATAIALVWMVAFRRPGRVLLPRALVPLTLFVGFAAMTGSWAADPTLGFKEVAKWLQLLVALVATVDLARRPSDLGPVLAAGGLALVAEAGAGILQAALLLGPDSFLVGPLLRAYGTFEQPNPFAGYLALQLPVALALFLRPRGVRRWAGGAVALVAGAGVLLSLSRGAWLGLAFGVPAVAAASRVGARRALLGAGVLIAVGAVVLLTLNFTVGLADLAPTRLRLIGEGIVGIPETTEEFNKGNYAVLQRVAFWTAAVRMIAAYPFGGVGLGNFAARYSDFNLGRWPESLGHAHNFFLNLTAETGFIGLALFLAFLFSVLAAALRAARTVGPYRAVAIGAAGTLLVFAFHNLVDSVFVGGLGVIVGIAAGLALSLDPNGGSSRRPSG